MRFDEQLDFVASMEEYDEAERERRIRELAEQAAAYTGRGSFHYSGATVDPPRLPSYIGEGIGPTAMVKFDTIALNIHPAIRGFARQLVAEEIIRKQLGDKQ